MLEAVLVGLADELDVKREGSVQSRPAWKEDTRRPNVCEDMSQALRHPKDLKQQLCTLQLGERHICESFIHQW